MEERTRRKKGEGGAVRAGRGWKGRVRVGADTVCGPVRRGENARQKAEKDALRLAQDLRPGKCPTLKAWAYDCLTGLYGQRLAVSTFNTNDAIRRNQINVHPLALKKIDAITRRDLKRFAAEIEGSPAWIRRVMGFVSALFTEAIEENYIEFNPAFRLGLPTIPERNNRVVTAAEAVRLMNPRDNVYEQMLAVYLRCGLRRAELCRAQHRDLGNDDKLWVRGTKNNYSAVPLKLKPEVADILRRQPKRSEYIFTDAAGAAIKPATLTQWFKRHREQLGLPPNMRLQDLRGSFATFLVASGADPKTVQTQLRHGNVRSTLKWYAMPQEETQVEALESMEKLIRTRARKEEKNAGQESLFG